MARAPLLSIVADATVLTAGPLALAQDAEKPAAVQRS